DDDDWTPPRLSSDRSRPPSLVPPLSLQPAPENVGEFTIGSPDDPFRQSPNEADVLRAGVDQLRSSDSVLQDMNGVLGAVGWNKSGPWETRDPLSYGKDDDVDSNGVGDYPPPPTKPVVRGQSAPPQAGSSESGVMGIIGPGGNHTRFNGFGGDFGGERTLTSVHSLRLHTYLKPTFCDACTQLLVGLMNQGLQCNVCRMNIHAGCRGIACSEEHVCRPPEKIQISAGVEEAEI
ncbi:unnamed protein product, partial [Discosporangium mesarthrocarpum]